MAAEAVLEANSVSVTIRTITMTMKSGSGNWAKI